MELTPAWFSKLLEDPVRCIETFDSRWSQYVQGCIDWENARRNK